MPLLDQLRRLTTAIPYPDLLSHRKPVIENEPGEEWEACENPACGGLKDRHRIQGKRRFEGRLTCSEECWRSILRQRIERELFAREAGRIVMHAHRVPLGLLLLSMGCITEEQLQAALEAQRKAKEGRIGEWLRRLTSLSEK